MKISYSLEMTHNTFTTSNTPFIYLKKKLVALTLKSYVLANLIKDKNTKLCKYEISCVSVVGMRSALAWYQAPAAASVPSSRVKQWTVGPLKMGPIGYPETSVTINMRCIASQNSKDFISRLPTTLFTKLWCQYKLHLTVSRQRSYSKIWHTWVAHGKQYFIRLAWRWPMKSKLTTLELIQQVFVYW